MLVALVLLLNRSLVSPLVSVFLKVGNPYLYTPQVFVHCSEKALTCFL